MYIHMLLTLFSGGIANKTILNGPVMCNHIS